MELNYVNKNLKPTLDTPTKQGKQVDTYFKKQMTPTGMVIKEDELLNEKEQSLKKKIFKLDKMETLVHTDEYLSKVFNDLKQNADELYGYHWNETILNMIFNDYVLNSPKYLDKYKNTRAKTKTRRGEEGIAQLQKDIDKEQEVTSGAEERKQKLMKGSNKKEKDDDNVDEGIMDTLLGRGVEVNLPVNKLSKNDTYFVDVAKKKLLAHVPHTIKPEERQEIISKYVGNPNYKQLSWFDAVSRGIKGVPREVGDGSYDQMKAEFDKKYARQGGIEAIPALAEQIQTGQKYKISDGSGLDSNKIVTVVDPKMIKTDGSGIPVNVAGAYKPIDWKKEVAIQYDNGEIGVMFKNRLQPVMSENNHGEMVDFDIPEWAISALINGDESGLTDEDSTKLAAFNKRVVDQFGNANFILGDIEGEDNLGFKHSNDIDNLGSNVYRLYIRPSKSVNETEGAADAGAYSMGLDAQNGFDGKIADKTYQNETTTSASSGQYSGKAIWSKNAKPAANKPAWKGGQIIGESVINGDLDYLTNPAAFKKYILKNQVAELLTESYNVSEAESIKRDAEKYLAKFKETLNQNPHLIDDKDFMDGLNLQSFRAKTGKAYPEEMEKETVPVQEHHITSKEEMIDFILQHTYDDSRDTAKYSKDQLDAMSDEEISTLYDATEKEIGITEQPEGDAEKGDGLFKGKWNTNESENDKSEVYYEIEMRLRPTDPSLSMSELQDISNEYGVDFEEVLQTMNQVLGDRENRKGEDAREIVADALKELGHNHEKTVTLEELKNYIASNYDTTEIDSDQIEIAYEKMTTDPNQLSLFQEQLMFERAVSKAQQQFMGMVHAYKKGDLDDPSPAVEKAADSMSNKDAEDFASTKHKGLPDHVDEGEHYYVEYFKEMQGEPPFKLGGKTYKYVWAKYPGGKVDIGVYDQASDLVIDYDIFRKQHRLDEATEKRLEEARGLWDNIRDKRERGEAPAKKGEKGYPNEKQWKKLTNKTNKKLDESMIDDQPDSIINPQANSIAASMDSDELNKDGVPVAASSIGGVQENDEPAYYHSGSDDPQVAIDANNFREKLKSKYGVDSVDQLSNMERAELIKSMNFDSAEKTSSEPEMDYSQFKATDDQKAEFKGRDEKRLAYLAQNADQVTSVDDYNRLASSFKKETGENMHHPMAILASIQALPQGSELRNKLTNIENALKSNMKESVNEERKNSAILNVEKLGKENAKNFKSDSAKEDALNQDKAYPYKKEGIYNEKVWPDPSKFYIEQDLEKVQKNAKSMEDIEKEALKKTKGALENIGDSTADGKHIPKRNLTKEEGYALAMNRGDGMQDIVYDNKPSEKFEKRMEQDMGEEVYKARQEKMEYKKDAPMYNKDTQPTEDGDKKKQDNKFEKGYNSESVTGKYRDEFNKVKLVEFKLGDVTIVESIEKNAIKISFDGMGNKYSLINKKITENYEIDKIINEYQFYLTENGYVAIHLNKKEMIVENKFDKMKHLINYKPYDYVDTTKSLKF